MKNSLDPRHKRRVKILEELFAESFVDQPHIDPETNEIWNMKDDLDSIITKAAPQWPLDKLNRVDLAVLRLAVYELKKGETPAKVVINEAVELSKEYGSVKSGSFVNGVLATIYKEGNNDQDY